MNRELAQKLLPLVNDANAIAELQLYVDDRLSLLRDQLEVTKDMQMIYEVQGKIAELKRFSTLRDEVLSKKDN